jgi:hypothetical protein
MNTIEDLKEYIKETYNIEPDRFDGKVLKYRSIEFERNTKSAISANHKSSFDMWTVRRSGHSVDFFRTEELSVAVSKCGSLPYYFLPQ